MIITKTLTVEKKPCIIFKLLRSVFRLIAGIFLMFFGALIYVVSAIIGFFTKKTCNLPWNRDK